jgi:hypothetical protein
LADELKVVSKNARSAIIMPKPRDGSSTTTRLPRVTFMLTRRADQAVTRICRGGLNQNQAGGRAILLYADVLDMLDGGDLVLKDMAGREIPGSRAAIYGHSAPGDAMLDARRVTWSLIPREFDALKRIRARRISGSKGFDRSLVLYALVLDASDGREVALHQRGHKPWLLLPVLASQLVRQRVIASALRGAPTTASLVELAGELGCPSSRLSDFGPGQTSRSAAAGRRPA